MPELPEVETINKQLREKLVGLTIKNIIVGLKKQFHGDEKEAVGAKIIRVRRKGKVSVIDLQGGKSLMIHLKMTGQLIFQDKNGVIAGGHPIPFAKDGLPAKSTHVTFEFMNEEKLYFNDVRQFGWVKLVDTSEVEKMKEFGKLGPEPNSEEFTVAYLKKILSKAKKAVKLIIMDQEKIAGVGNIYANDALFEAKINPGRSGNKLSDREIIELKKGIDRVISEGIKYGGSSAADESYVDAMGNPGRYQKHFRVYQKNGEKCPNRCGGVIERVNLGGRGTFFCPKCQK